MKERPIYNKLKNINKSKVYPFHMPGHKRNKKFLNDFYEFIDLDFTEIDETDNMHKPEGIIKQSKNILSKTFGSQESYFLVNGSTCGIIASLLSILKPNENILVARNCHISVHNGIMLCEANPIYILPDVDYNFPSAINPKVIQNAINKYNIKACIITSPTYEGITSNIREISNILHKKNIPLIVDEAHGAHFCLSTYFPQTALEQGADIVIQSFHKTLPALTQCAVLHINSNIINKNRLEKSLSVLQSTSPSYIFMMSLEYCCYYINNYQHLINKYIDKLKILRKNLLTLKNFKLIDKDILKNKNIDNFDISRITLLIKKNVSGSFINELLIKEGIQLEMYNENHIIAISTICDTDFGLDLLFKSLKKIDSYLEKFSNKITIENTLKPNNNIIKPKVRPKNMFYEEQQEVNFKLAENKICADFIIPYPPGIPLITPGEIITNDLINNINDLINSNINILGINENKIKIKKD